MFKYYPGFNCLIVGFQETFTVDNERLTDKLVLVSETTAELVSLVETMKLRIELVPESADIDDIFSAHLHPLSLIHSGHPELSELKQNTNHSFELAKSIRDVVQQLEFVSVVGIFDR